MNSWFIWLILFYFVSSSLVEEERVAEYHSRGHEWPPKEQDYKPRTAGWKGIFERRLAQIERVENLDEKYNGLVSAVYAALIGPNFTEYGYGLTRAPQYLVEDVQASFFRGFQQNPPLEEGDLGIQLNGTEYKGKESLMPLFVDTHEINRKVLTSVKPILESWAGVPLVANNAYGLRVYRNGSILRMHLDKPETHVISAIFHVSHDPESEPWPLVIEDFKGNTVEVFMEPGDMLLYESSKCYHGRPRTFQGKWYTSIFLHYYPQQWPASYTLDTHYRISPHWWKLEPPLDNLQPLKIDQTSVLEPTCHFQWCALNNASSYFGPGEIGIVYAGGSKQNLNIHDEL